MKILADAYYEADERARLEMEARIKGETPPLMLMPPDRIPDGYAIEVFEKAELYQRATGNPVFNPMRIQPHSLEDIDAYFVAQKALFEDWIKYYTDMHLRPEGLK